MNVRNTVKKIAALGAGMTMVGATIFGASAVSLVDYPGLLFKDGVFDASIVVGENAKASDVAAAIEDSTHWQSLGVRKKMVSAGAGATFEIDKGFKVRRTGHEFGYGSSFLSVMNAPLDDADLPALLKRGIYDDDEGSNKDKEEYTQELRFSSTTGTGQLVFTDKDSGNEEAATYLWFDDGSANTYTYELEFTTAISYDSSSSANAGADLENTELEIQGNVYTITDVTLSGASINKMELLAGKTVVWMQQDEPLTKDVGGVSHTVVLKDVNEDEDKCGISVDGTTTWVDVGQTKTINGVQIGVTDAIVTHSAGKDTDVCEVNIGATKLTLEEGRELKKDDVDVDNSEVRFLNTSAQSTTVGRWLGFNVSYRADDELFLAPGQAWTDPSLDNFKFEFGGLTAEYDEVSWSSSGDKATLKFNNYDGRPVEIEWRLNKTNNRVVLGEDFNRRLLRPGDSYDCGATGEDCEKQQLFAVTSGNVLHVLEIDDVDVTNNRIDMKDVTYANNYDDKSFTADGTMRNVDLGSVGQLQIAIDNGNGTINYSGLVGGGVAYTRYEAVINLSKTEPAQLIWGNMTSGVNNVSQDFNLTRFDVVEDNEDLYGSNGTNVGNWTFIADDADNDDDIELRTPVFVGGTGQYTSSTLQKSRTEDKRSMIASMWGSILEYDNDDNDDLSLKIPKTQAYANVFIAPVSAMVSGGTGGVETVEIVPIGIGASKLDSDIQQANWKNQNLIVYGGPCANVVAQWVEGNPEPCTTGYKEGEAKIKLADHGNGKWAMLVAGYNWQDTMRAGRVLADPALYKGKLVGNEVKVKGTSMADIRVEAVV